ncbi:Mariner Mos1 transposase [Acromyrmex echinatior]|uniref:Mariner Mos1 transposase n=1 Tax=Acromyrmex echinatior TaxID=103372 RepID=F4WMU0_ACREC|nr:Mariner Mos1 transposase [Acromyrmex echinatior]
MPNFVPTKRNLREALLFCFHLKKSAVESQRMLSEACDNINYTSSISICQPKKFEEEEMKALFDQDRDQTQEELAESLNVDRSTIFRLEFPDLKAIGMIQKQGN